jgi:hypothetical protein
MSENKQTRAPGQDWIDIVRQNGTAQFATAFAQDVVLDASVMNAPRVGGEAVSAFFSATSGMYDRISFTYETVAGAKTYLEWEGQAFGMDVAGSTTLTRNRSGLIETIRLYHRPLHMVVKFSAELGRRLKGKLDPALFGLHGLNITSTVRPRERARNRRLARRAVAG